MSTSTTILILVLMLLITISLGVIGYFAVSFFRNPLNLPGYKNIGESCTLSTDCKGWGYGSGGFGVTCCPQKLNDITSGKCTAKKDLIRGGFVCKYPPNTWLAAGDVPYANELCLSGKSKHGKGLDILCA